VVAAEVVAATVVAAAVIAAAVDTVAEIAIVETAAAVVDTTDINLINLPTYKTRSEFRTSFFYSYI
jgi:hypothetical protein